MRYEICWDQKVHTPKAVKHNRPDVMVIDRVGMKWTMIEFAVCFDANVDRKTEEGEEEDSNIYNKLAYKVKVDIVPIVVGVLVVVSKELEG